MHIKTVILLGNFFHLVCVMLLICQRFFIKRFLCFHKKNAFFNLGVNVFYIYGLNEVLYPSLCPTLTNSLPLCGCLLRTAPNGTTSASVLSRLLFFLQNWQTYMYLTLIFNKSKFYA